MSVIKKKALEYNEENETNSFCKLHSMNRIRFSPRQYVLNISQETRSETYCICFAAGY